MARFLAALFIALISSNSAFAFFDNPLARATAVQNFGANDVYRSIQCELGQFAAYAAKRKIPFNAALQAQYAYSGATEVSTKVSFSAELGIKIAQVLSGPGVSLSLQQITNRTITTSDNLNINGANIGKWCKGKVPVEVYSCLVETADNLNTGHAKCASTVTAHGVLSANAKVIIWYINVGPGFDYDVKRTFTISIEAPPPK